ncbi:hypothetical protein [Mesorhizobium sp. M0276]|uniref:hypothetical protein n=1 Tax=Mesorhizobium sp. M0276 TaxID=2956928 RepID=UPI00333B7B89
MSEHNRCCDDRLNPPYLPPAHWETLEEISFRTRDPQGKRIPQERLVAEALNLLFVKYNYPQVREGGD